MTRREVLTEICKPKRCPERMGLFEWFWQDTQAEWETQGLPKGVDLVDHFGHDVREIKGSMFRVTGRPVDDVVVGEDAETVVKRNGWGALHREWKSKPGVPEHLGFEMTSAAVWKAEFRDRLLGLDVRRFPDWDGLVAAYKAGMASDRFCVYQQMLVVEIMRRAMGDVIFLESMVLDPDWIHDFCSVMTDNIILHLDYMIREVGKPDGIWTYDDMGYTRAPFFSPAMYREFIFPEPQEDRRFLPRPRPALHPARLRLYPAVPARPRESRGGRPAPAGSQGRPARGRVLGYREGAGRRDGLRRQHGHPGLRVERPGRPGGRDPAQARRLSGEKRIPYIFMSDHSIPRTVRLEDIQEGARSIEGILKLTANWRRTQKQQIIRLFVNYKRARRLQQNGPAGDVSETG